MASRPIVKTKYGALSGIKKISCYQTPFIAFHNIPFARQPIGELRFQDPKPPETWQGTRDASKPGNVCHQFGRLQPGEKRVLGSDDCLNLNVYTKNLTPTMPYPVMVYIHGGRFATGTGGPPLYNPDYLLEHDVILVSINYRLAAFGFLSFKDPSIGIPGNAGLKDQTMALRWVKENISSFGGDPNNVTLFGESAGGCSVHLHLMSPLSKGLFQRAILMSGTALSYWNLSPAKDFPYRLAKLVGYDGPNQERPIYEFLKDADPHKLVMAELNIFNTEEKLQVSTNAFGPVVEPYTSELMFLPVTPEELATSAWGNQVDIIIGGTSDEGLFLWPAISEQLFKVPNLLDYVVSSSIKENPKSEKAKSKAATMQEFYYGEESPTIDNVHNYVDLLTDKIFWHGIHRTIRARQQDSAGKTWLYRFSVPPVSNTFIREMYGIPHNKGMCHVEDLFFVFRWDFLDAPAKDSEEYEVIKKAVRYLK